MIIPAKYAFFAIICLLIFAGCANAPETVEMRVQLGMSRDTLRSEFGEPLRIEPVAGGGEDWYYNFVIWQAQPTSEAGKSLDGGEVNSYVSANINLSKQTMEQPMHVSAEGVVWHRCRTAKS